MNNIKDNLDKCLLFNMDKYFLFRDNEGLLIKFFKQLNQEEKDSLLKDIVINKNSKLADIKNLLNYGAKITEEYANAFYLACSHNKKDIMEYFFDVGYKHQKTINIAFRTACTYGRIEIAELLLNNNADINYDHNKSFLNACKCNNYEMVDFLIKKGVDINVQEGKGLIYACANNYINLAKLLLKNNADVHVQDEKPLAFAIRNENDNLIQLLKNYGARQENITHTFQKEIYSLKQIKISKKNKEVGELHLKLKSILGCAEDDLSAPQLVPPDKNFKFEKFLHLNILNPLHKNNIQNESHKVIKKFSI